MARAVKIESDKTLPKKRKTRKPMSAEQKKAAGERLAIAREKRARENPPEYKSIHPDVLAKGDEHPWSHINVKKWIKTQKELLTVARKPLLSITITTLSCKVTGTHFRALPTKAQRSYQSPLKRSKPHPYPPVRRDHKSRLASSFKS